MDFSNFKDFSVWLFYNPPFLALLRKIVLKTGSQKVQNGKVLKIKILTNLIIYYMLGCEKNFNQILPLFGHFFQISPKFFAIVQKAPIPHFRDCPNFVPLGK